MFKKFADYVQARLDEEINLKPNPAMKKASALATANAIKDTTVNPIKTKNPTELNAIRSKALTNIANNPASNIVPNVKDIDDALGLDPNDRV